MISCFWKQRQGYMLILCFRKSTFNQIKSEEDRLRRWTLKRFLSDFYGQNLICEFILALVSLWLLVNPIKKNPKEKRPIDFFLLFYSKILWLFYYYFASYGFKCGYDVKDRLDFILTEFKRYYNLSYPNFVWGPSVCWDATLAWPLRGTWHPSLGNPWSSVTYQKSKGSIVAQSVKFRDIPEVKKGTIA